MHRVTIALFVTVLVPTATLFSEPPARTDAYGDPLPPGVVARLGSARLRHAGLSSFVFVDDGRTILSAGSDRTLRFWDAESGKQIRRVTLQGKQALARLALSGNGKWVAGYDQGRITLWDVETGKELKSRNLEVIPQDFFDSVFFGRHDKIVVLLFNGQVTFWDWQEDAERRLSIPRIENELGRGTSYHARVSPDGKWMVAGRGREHALCLYDLSTWREVHQFNCNPMTSTYTPDSRRVIVSCMTKNDRGWEPVLRVFELATLKEVACIPLNIKEAHYYVACSPDGRTLAFTSGVSGAWLFDWTTGKVVRRLPVSGWGLRFSPDGGTLLLSYNIQLRLFDVETGKERHDRHPAGFDSETVTSVSPDGRLLAAGDWSNRTINLWELTSGRLVRQFPLKGQQQSVRNLAFSPDGQSLTACQAEGFLQSWELATGTERFTLQLQDPEHPNKDGVWFYQLHVSPDGKHVSTMELFGGRQASARLGVWDTATGKIEHQHSLTGEIGAAAWFHDGSAVALALADGLRLMDAKTGRVRFHVPGTSARGPVALSPDDRLVAIPLAAKDGEQAAVGVWETATGKEVVRVATGKVHHLRLLPGNRWLVTTDEGFLRVWDLATNSERHRWPLPEAVTDTWGRSFVYALDASPDGRQAITILADGTALVWDLTPAWRD